MQSFKRDAPRVATVEECPKSSGLARSGSADDTVRKAAERRRLTELTGRCAPYGRPILARSLGQLLFTVVLLVVVWAAMLYFLDVGYLLTLLLALPAAGLVVRLFIIQHDCGHRSFFRSRRANDILGWVLGVFTLTPYAYWRRAHAMHHATSGNLDRRGVGDVDTLTVDEYLAKSAWQRFQYRAYRNPFVLFSVGAIYWFFLKHRIPLGLSLSFRDVWRSVLSTNLAILSVGAVLALTVGFGPLLLVQGPIMVAAAIAGTWLFYVQHQFEGAYWERDADWSFTAAAINGSSHYVLPRILQWFTGNIGLHHIHHLSSKIPNYRLQECLDREPSLQSTTQLTLFQSIKCTTLALWDEKQRKLVRFRDLKAIGCDAGMGVNTGR